MGYLFACARHVKTQEQAESDFQTYVDGCSLYDDEGTQRQKIVLEIRRIFSEHHPDIVGYLAAKIDLLSRFSV
jgi:hypothetical protein